MGTEHILGLITGVIFGFLLQKGRVLRFEKQVGALLLRDMTIMKFMLSAVMVGMIGVYALHSWGAITLSHKSANIGGLVLGGALFGAGWAIMGFCPGTSLGAIGEGRWHAVFALLGMLVGAAVFAELFPFVKSTVLAMKDFGKLSLPDALGIPPWPVIGAFWVVSIGLLVWFEKKGL